MTQSLLKGDLIAVYSFLTGGAADGEMPITSLVTSDRTRGNGMKLLKGGEVQVGRWRKVLQ